MANPQQYRQRAPFARGKRMGNGKMQRNFHSANPQVQDDSQTLSAAPNPSPALNCIVDESALLAGLETSDGLKKWIREGSINVFVPLYTLEKLNMLRSSPPPLNLTARKTLEWLDHITSVTENKTAGHVGLQGPDDQYQTWKEVEKYLLPDTPLSAHNGPSNLDGITKSLEGGLNISNGPVVTEPLVESGITDSGLQPGTASPHGSPKDASAVLAGEHEKSHQRHISVSSSLSAYSEDDGSGPDTILTPAINTAGIPSSVRPLLNYVVWRTYNQDASIVGSGRYVLLTNDPVTRKHAQQFGVRAKLLSQVRTIVSRFQSKSPQQNQSNGAFKNNRSGRNSMNNIVVQNEDNGDEDEVVFNPASRPGSSRNAHSAVDVWDPDHFGRTPVPVSGATETNTARKEFSSPRQRTGSRGSGAFIPTGPASAVRGQSRGGRGQSSSSARGQSGSARGTPRHKLEKPIDPDSYARPPPPPARRGRGGFRRLWDPNT